MVAVTGVQAVKRVGEVKSGDKVVILGGSSGTGSFNIQIAKALGAEVFATTTSNSKIEFVKENGADIVVNSSETDWSAKVMEWTDGKGADVIIDNLGGKFTQDAINATKKGGIIVAMGFVDSPNINFDVRSLFFGQKQLRGSLMGTKEDLEFALALVKEGKLKPQLDAVLPLSEAAKSHEMLINNVVKGNIVLVP